MLDMAVSMSGLKYLSGITPDDCGAYFRYAKIH